MRWRVRSLSAKAVTLVTHVNVERLVRSVTHGVRLVMPPSQRVSRLYRIKLAPEMEVIKHNL